MPVTYIPGYELEIAGNTIDPAIHPFALLMLAEVVRGASRLDIEIASDDGWRCAENDGIRLLENGEVIFGGLINEVGEETINWESANRLTISAWDLSAYPSQTFITATIPAGTLKAALIVLAADLNAKYGTTLDPAQVDGPSIGELVLVDRRIDEVLNDLGMATPEGYVWEIDYTNVLRMFDPATRPAPFDIVQGDDNHFGDVKVRKARNSEYANRVIVRSPPVDYIEYHEYFSGDGVTTKFFLTGKLLQHYGTVFCSDTGNEERLDSVVNVGNGAEWQYDPADNSIERFILGAPAAAVDNVRIKYNGRFEASAMAQDVGEQAPPRGLVEVRIPAAEGLPAAALQEIADGELARRLAPVRKAVYPTDKPGLRVGQTQNIDVILREFDEPCLLSEIRAYQLGAQIVRTVSATVSTRFQGSFQDGYKRWNTIGGGGVMTGAGTVVSTGSPLGAAPPEGAQQFYKNGYLAGSEFNRFLEPSVSLVVGEDNTITAASYNHVFIFGKDCHVVDP